MGKVRVLTHLPKPTTTEFSLENIPVLGLPEFPWWFVFVIKSFPLLVDNSGQTDTMETVQFSASETLQSQKGARRA